MQVQIDPVDYEIVANRKTVKQDLTKIHKTHPHPQTSKLDIFPFTNRTLIDYNKLPGINKLKEIKGLAFYDADGSNNTEEGIAAIPTNFKQFIANN